MDMQPMLCAMDSEWITHSQWCEQVAEQDFEYVACTCGALKHEMLRLRQVEDAKRWRWCVEHPYEAMMVLMEATNADSYGRPFTFEDVQSYFVRGIDTAPERGPAQLND